MILCGTCGTLDESTIVLHGLSCPCAAAYVDSHTVACLGCGALIYMQPGSGIVDCPSCHETWQIVRSTTGAPG